MMALDYVYFMGGTYYFDDAMGYTMYELADNITFDYDADKKVMTASEGICMMVNASSKRVYYINMYEAPVIKLRNPNPNPVPRNPVPQSYNDFFENFGYSIIMFNLSSLNAEDDILDTANMYYEVSIDGELMTFYTDDYDIEEDMTQIPYNFTDSKGIFVTGETRMVYLYFAGFETIGLQLFNVVDGTSYASPKTIWNVLDNSYIVEDNTGVEAVAANRSISMVEYFNLQGIKIERPEKGINICRTTMEDGSINVTKVLVK